MIWKSVYLLGIFFLAFQGRIFGAAEEDSSNATEVSENAACGPCAYYRCDDWSQCLFGIAIDPCGCCLGGICAKVGGEVCWNDNIPQLPKKARTAGVCAENYLCQLSTDLPVEDDSEAICVCKEQTLACGNNNETYLTPCALHEAAMRQKNSSLRLQQLGPCISRPWILTPLKNVAEKFGRSIALKCEAKGFPAFDLFWQFRSVNTQEVLNLPSEKHEALVHTSEVPETLIQSSWLQLARLGEQHVGWYYCIANNTIGESGTFAYISLI